MVRRNGSSICSAARAASRTEGCRHCRMARTRPQHRSAAAAERLPPQQPDWTDLRTAMRLRARSGTCASAREPQDSSTRKGRRAVVTLLHHPWLRCGHPPAVDSPHRSTGSSPASKRRTPARAVPPQPRSRGIPALWDLRRRPTAPDYSPITVTIAVRFRGPSNSQKYTDCQAPSTMRPCLTGTVTLNPTSDALM